MMTLTALLAYDSSPVAQFFARHCNAQAIDRFLAKQGMNTPLTETGDTLAEMAFLYALRWKYEPIHPVTTFAYIGAKLLDKADIYCKMVWEGNFNADKRLDIARVMAAYEMYARTGQWHDPQENALLDKWVDNLPDKLTNYLHRYVHAPTFSGSEYVGGAHASMIIDSTLFEVCFCPDRLDRGTFVKGIAHLVLDFNNTLGVSNLAFYFPHNAQLFLFPIPTIVRDIAFLRLSFQQEVSPVKHKPFDRHCTDYLGFQRYDFDFHEDRER